MAVLLINQGTQSAVNFDQNGTVYTQVVHMESGTVNVGTISSLPNISGGTIGLITRVSTIGTVEVGTISAMPNIPGGTVGLITRVNTLGTLEVGTISSLPNIPGGTITNLVSGTINSGTVTMTAGTVRNDGRPSRNILSYGTTFGGTAAGYSTVVAAPGVGTSTWVSDVSINNPYGSIVCMVGFGTALQGTSVLIRGVYGTQVGVGIQKSYPMAVNSGMTNTDLVAYIGAAGTIDVSVSYFVSA